MAQARGMSETTTVTVDELRRASEAMLDWLEQWAGESVEIDVDLFWWIDAKEVYNPYRNPKDLSIGSIDDSIDLLRRIVDADEPIANGLVWLSQLLRAVGDTMMPR